MVMLRGDVLLVHLVIAEFMMRWDTCCDLDADQNLTNTDSTLFSFSPSSRKEWSRMIHLLAWRIEASLAF